MPSAVKRRDPAASLHRHVQGCAETVGPPCRKLIPVSETYDGDKFFVVKEGVRMATPLLLALAVIEISDVAFAVDSIPAVLPHTLASLFGCQIRAFDPYQQPWP